MKNTNSILLDDKCKNISWRNRNYFFVVTIAIVLLNIFLYAFVGSNPGDYSVKPDWGKFSVANLFQAFLNSFEHANVQHVLLNMLCFFIAGLYLERKQGSIKFLLFIFLMLTFTAFASTANSLVINWRGFSGVNYGLYGFILVEYLFTLCRKAKRDLFNILFGLIVVLLIYLAMCFNGGTVSVGFAWYPYDLLHNLGHASGFVTGLILGVYEQFCAVLHQS